MKILVCGSRDFEDTWIIHAVLDGLLDGVTPASETTIIEGQCPYGGADRIAARWAIDRHATHRPFPAAWDRRGKRAGPERNQRMIEAEPDLVFAFVNKPLAESRGTADMVRRAREAGVRTWVIEAAS